MCGALVQLEEVRDALLAVVQSAAKGEVAGIVAGVEFLQFLQVLAVKERHEASGNLDESLHERVAVNAFAAAGLRKALVDSAAELLKLESAPMVKKVITKKMPRKTLASPIAALALPRSDGARRPIRRTTAKVST